MAKHATSLLALFCFQALFHYGIGQYDRTFDYFKLVLQWPLSVCSGANTRPCQVNPVPENFTIHGFYPTDVGAERMHDCYDLPYTRIEWQDLIDRLNRNWPSLVQGPRYNFFHWKRQWIKHGTCSLIFYYQLMYFDLASDLKDEFDILRGLRDREIVPTDLFMYSIQEIRDAVKDFTTKTCDVNCVVSRRGNLLISEIRICFSPGGEIIDCYPQDFVRRCNRPFAYFPETLNM